MGPREICYANHSISSIGNGLYALRSVSGGCVEDFSGTAFNIVDKLPHVSRELHVLFEQEREYNFLFRLDNLIASLAKHKQAVDSPGSLSSGLEFGRDEGKPTGRVVYRPNEPQMLSVTTVFSGSIYVFQYGKGLKITVDGDGYAVLRRAEKLTGILLAEHAALTARR